MADLEIFKEKTAFQYKSHFIEYIKHTTKTKFGCVTVWPWLSDWLIMM